MIQEPGGLEGVGSESITFGGDLALPSCTWIVLGVCVVLRSLVCCVCVCACVRACARVCVCVCVCVCVRGVGGGGW